MQYGDFAKIYDELMYDAPYERWTAFVRQQLAGAREIVELGCGTGEATLALAETFSVTALDSSEDMLEVAACKLRAAGRPVRLIHADMRTFSLHRPVDAAVCVCDGINYLCTPEEVQAAFLNIRQNIRPGGMFIFDISSEYKLAAMDGQLYSEDTDEVTYIWRSRFEKETRLLTMDIAFFVAEDETHYRRFDEEHVQRAHWEEEIVLWLKQAGFDVLSVTDDYTGQKNTEKTMRLTFCARACDTV